MEVQRQARAGRAAAEEAYQRQIQQFSAQGTKVVTECRLVEAQRQARADRAAAEEAQRQARAQRLLCVQVGGSPKAGQS